MSRHLKKLLVTSSYLLLVVRPGASSSVLAPSSKALVTSSYLLLVVRPGQELLVASLLLVAMPFVPSSFLLLLVWPGATSSVLAASSDAPLFLVASCY